MNIYTGQNPKSASDYGLAEGAFSVALADDGYCIFFWTTKDCEGKPEWEETYGIANWAMVIRFLRLKGLIAPECE
jgi:hypothetical protein